MISYAAARLNKHSVKMERQLSKLEKFADLLIESDVGYIAWASARGEQLKQKFIGAKPSFSRALGLMEINLKGMELFLSDLKSYREVDISQQMNTALNRMIYGTDSVLVCLRRVEKHWNDVIRTIDAGLTLEGRK